MAPEMRTVITAYCSNCKSVELRDLANPPEFPADVVWIDMVEPTSRGGIHIEKILGIEVPTRDDLRTSSPRPPLRRKGCRLHDGFARMESGNGTPTLTDVGLHSGRQSLVTIRYANPKSFALFIAALHRYPSQWRSGAALLAKLLETIVDRTAEVLEQAVARIDILSIARLWRRAKKVRKSIELSRRKASRTSPAITG